LNEAKSIVDEMIHSILIDFITKKTDLKDVIAKLKEIPVFFQQVK
jgi:hypothetical protein